MTMLIRGIVKALFMVVFTSIMFLHGYCDFIGVSTGKVVLSFIKDFIAQ